MAELINVQIEQRFKVSKEKLWKAITDVEEMRQWFFENIPDFKAEIGFKIQFDVDAGERHFLHIWEITEVEPQKSIVYDWRYGGYLGTSELRMEIREEEEGVCLKLSHKEQEEFSANVPEFSAENCQQGWEYFIKERLVDYLSNK